MKTFIQVVELWVPNADGTHLEHGGSLSSGAFAEFNALSEGTLFQRDEGLPGKAWASGHPVILTDFANSYFRRTDAAHEAGLTCGVALPVFAGETLKAVLVLFCGDDESHVGAIELWHNDAEATHEMRLVDGYYGTADMLEFNSRHTSFPRGFGLPGRTWKADMPLIAKDFANSKSFLRWEDAVEIGVNRGVGIPYKTPVDQTWVVTLLSARATPLARRFEVWVPNADGDALLFHAGDCDSDTDLAARYAGKAIARGEGALGRAWATDMPVITDALLEDRSVASVAARESRLHQMVVLPTMDAGVPKAMLAWYL